MSKTKTARKQNSTKISAEMYLAIELSSKNWKLAFSNGAKDRFVSVKSGDLMTLEQSIQTAKKRLKLPVRAKVLSCFEAGRDGFWLHHYLLKQGINNLVVDSSSIEVNRRKRRCKTDRIDVKALLGLLIRYDRPIRHGDKRCFSVLRIPDPAMEDERRLNREIGCLKEEETAHRNRIRSILVTLGLRLKSFVKFPEYLSQLRLWDGSEVPAHTQAELLREYTRYELVHKQCLELERSQKKWLEEGETQSFRTAKQLTSLRGVGSRGSVILSQEIFGWRKFSNRRELAASVGLTPTPYNSGEGEREQGISKAGNHRARSVMIQLAWSWLRYQPQSELSQWFHERFSQGKRMRRVGIVAVARKLLILFWKYLEHEEIPEGVLLSG
ncbi:MAG: IS110 family transposase [Planctomycetes bacterium]|nr:IS110 family transposase [Planctomycetota bacterium]